MRFSSLRIVVDWRVLRCSRGCALGGFQLKIKMPSERGTDLQSASLGEASWETHGPPFDRCWHSRLDPIYETKCWLLGVMSFGSYKQNKRKSACLLLGAAPRTCFLSQEGHSDMIVGYENTLFLFGFGYYNDTHKRTVNGNCEMTPI